MLSFQEQKYAVITLLALLIITIALYQSQQMDISMDNSVHSVGMEGFADGDANTSDENELLESSRIYKTGRILDGIRSAQNIQYPDYAGANTEFPVTAATLLEMQRGELGKINKGLQVEFIQALQDAEISGLKTRLEQVIADGKKKGVLTDSGSAAQDTRSDKPMRIRHLQSGAVFSTVSRGGPGSAETQQYGFGLILDKDRGTCIKYVANPSTSNGDGNNIEVAGCDYDPSLSSMRFRLKKIVSNDTYNRALHPDYTMYAIPEYNTLNAYPYYVITPVDDTSGTMCLTIDDRGASIEPCIGKHSQRFNLA